MQKYYEKYWEDVGNRGYSTPGQRRWSEQRKAELLLALHGLKPGSLILDAGCGTGEFTGLIAGQGFRVIGIDIASMPLTQIKTMDNTNLGFLVASVEGTLPFPNATFSAIWSTEVIEHLIHVGETFQEFGRVIQPGGLLILTTPFHGVAKNLVLSLKGYEKHYDPVGPHIRFYTRKSLNASLTQAGFIIEMATGVGRFWPLWMSHFVIARKVK